MAYVAKTDGTRTPIATPIMNQTYWRVCADGHKNLPDAKKCGTCRLPLFISEAAQCPQCGGSALPDGEIDGFTYDNGGVIL